LKRLAILDGYFHWPPAGGGIRDIAEVANGLSNQYEVTLICPAYGFRGRVDRSEELEFEVRKISFDIVSFNGPTVLRRFRSEIDDIEPDMIMVGNGNVMKPFMIKACEGIRTWVRLYSYELLCPVSHGLLFDGKRVCESNYTDAYLTCMRCWLRHPKRSAYNHETMRSMSVLPVAYRRNLLESLEIPESFIVTSKYMERRYGEIIEPDRLVRIPSGIDRGRFLSGDSSDSGLTRIFAAGRVSDPAKGIGTLIDAAENLWTERQDFLLEIAGHDVSLPERDYMHPLGWVPEERLPGAYASSDIVVVPSVWAEPFGLVALEGMGSGKPVVASRAGGLQDFVIDGMNGRLFEPGDSAQLTEILSELIDSPATRRRMGLRGLSTAEKYDWKKIISQYARLLEG